MNILTVVGFDYETYLEKWVALSKTEVNALPNLTKAQKKAINFGVKFLTSFVTVAFWTAMVIEFVVDPTWELFVMIIMRSLLIVVNGYSGYKFGYENIVFDTTNYINDQTDLMEQAITYFEETQD